MKKYTLITLIAVVTLLVMTGNSNAGVRFGVFVGGPGYYYPQNSNYGYRDYGPDYGYRDYNGYGRYHHYRHYRYYHSGR